MSLLQANELADRLKELQSQKWAVWFDKMKMNVELLNIRSNYGTINIEIKPVAGSGSKWVRVDSLVCR